ncbi:hypothetical protein [Cellvibrio mixtus]|nr:hypothetical protein [Cellvibrio mixtus]
MAHKTGTGLSQSKQLPGSIIWNGIQVEQVIDEYSFLFKRG